VTAIKPPGGPGGIQPPTSSPESSKTSGPAGPSFQERVAEQRPGAQPGAPATAVTSQSVVADLRAGRISPNDAVQRLTDLAVKRSGAPPAMRASVEAQLRDLMSRDPVIQDLLKEMGAAVAPEK
jgi:hypothetical protein